MTALPETILQFGAGRFLRAFVDLFVHQANEAGQGIGKIVVVQTQGDGRAGLLNTGDGKYHVVVRGLENGAVIDRVDEVGSISRALVAIQQWPEVLTVARSPALKFVISNTTEAGYNLDPQDRFDSAPANAFPAKLVQVLHARFKAGLPSVTLIPCELRENQADVLRDIAVKLATEWKLESEFVEWLRDRCVWLNTLVDRIVVNAPADHPIAASDSLAIMAEPFAFFALQDKPSASPFVSHPSIRRAPDVLPYFLRKVRILNGAHTALLIKAWPMGIRIVKDAMADPGLASWLERLLFEEIVPTLADQVEDAAGFARHTLERFRNPFLQHKLSDIALHHATKVKVRLEPTVEEFRQRFGKAPPLLTDVLEQNRSVSFS
jgi:tagaturonate reductase